MSFASSTCNGIAGWFLSLRSWKRWSAALILGALIPMSQPPVHLMPVLFVSFTGLVWLVDGTRTWRSAFGVGWLFGAGYHACGLYWVSEALLVDASRFAWLIPFNFFGLSLGLGLFTGIMALVARLFWRPGISRIFVLAGMWTLFEGLRGILFTGFPWNPVGNAWVAFDSVLQVASWIGVYGLSLVTVYASAAVALMA
ncbi:MAG: apolipoprotein N-acyltransferase, partial [Pseudomonadota bacterium]|nr:apolipoprotein N-acyltransferase [Pseudomonadota bacterium]